MKYTESFCHYIKYAARTCCASSTNDRQSCMACLQAATKRALATAENVQRLAQSGMHESHMQMHARLPPSALPPLAVPPDLRMMKEAMPLARSGPGTSRTGSTPTSPRHHVGESWSSSHSLLGNNSSSSNSRGPPRGPGGSSFACQMATRPAKLPAVLVDTSAVDDGAEESLGNEGSRNLEACPGIRSSQLHHGHASLKAWVRGAITKQVSSPYFAARNEAWSISVRAHALMCDV